LELVMAFPLASIKSQEQLQVAQEVMDQLLPRSELDDGQEMYLDAFSDLVAAYEDEHYAIEPASDADMLRHLMEAKGVSRAQLSKETTIPKSTISEILAGKKPFQPPDNSQARRLFRSGRQRACSELLMPCHRQWSRSPRLAEAHAAMGLDAIADLHGVLQVSRKAEIKLATD
jgi:HTH-type transcriptional regulator/antitoxin HigA